jgi:hypothetical protein
MEKLRRSPPFSRKSMYWPARNCHLGELLHAAGQQPHRDVLGGADRAALDHQLAQWLRLAEKRLAVHPLLLGEHARVVVAVVDGAADDFAFAGAASAVLAAVRQHHALAQRRREHRLAILDGEALTARLNCNFMHR